MTQLIAAPEVAARGSAGLRPRATALLAALLTGLVAFLVSAPLLAVVASVFEPGSSQGHIWATTGPAYLKGTLLLCLMVGFGTVVIGAGCALLVSLTSFPGKRFFSFALVTPFAVPAYMTAFVYGDLAGPLGQLAGAMRSVGLGSPDIKTLVGAAFILTLASYPYVYLAMRASLAGRSSSIMEAARNLGLSAPQALMRTILPLSRAALAGGLALGLMETAGDFGVADYFGVPTLSTGIFRTWYGLGDLTAASQVAAGLFAVALLLLLLEEAGRRGRLDDGSRSMRHNEPPHLSFGLGILAAIACALPPLLGFVVPVGALIAMGLAGGATSFTGAKDAFVNTGIAALIGAVLITLVALGLAAARRKSKSARLPASVRRAVHSVLRVTTLGYAMPGALVAIGILQATAILPAGTGSALIVGGGLSLLIYAYSVRFLTAAYNSVTGGLDQISPALDEAARSLGASRQKAFWAIEWPLARPSIVAGAMIVFVDIAKELPATLLLRPFNFETLATRVYRYASDERLAEVAVDALLLVAISLLPVALLNAASSRAARASTKNV